MGRPPAPLKTKRHEGFSPQPSSDAPQTCLCLFTGAFAVCPGSVLLFGSFSILLNVFHIGYSAVLIQCKSRVEIVFPSIEILFICTQVLHVTLLEACLFSLSHSREPKAWGEVGAHKAFS